MSVVVVVAVDDAALSASALLMVFVTKAFVSGGWLFSTISGLARCVSCGRLGSESDRLTRVGRCGGARVGRGGVLSSNESSSVLE